MATHRVDFVDEHDARRVFLGLLKHVAHTACTHTHKHLNEVRAGDGEEGHARFARNGARQKGFTGTGRAHKQCAFGDFAAQTGEFLRIAQELYDLFELFLGFINASDIIKGHAALLFGEHLGFGFAKAHCAAFATALHAVHEIDPDADQQEEWQQADQEGLKTGGFLAFGTHRNALLDQQACDFGIRRQHSHVI